MSPAELLSTGLDELGLQHDKAVIESFMLYLSELKKWNRAYSLTSLRSDHDIVVKHFLDSALYLKAIGNDISSIADIGSGAGFPGIPIRLLRPDIKMTLVEPSRKKAAFLKNITRELGISYVDVVEERVEDVEPEQLFDCATTRALFKAGEFFDNASHIVRPGGVLIMSKGPAHIDEIAGLAARHEVIEAPLPHTDITRYLLVMTNEKA